MKRVPDILDVWFDSGVCSWASLGYPQSKRLWKGMWPADLNLEGPDQIRGWWNSELITSVITFNKAPFKKILFHGFVLDAHGTKMSKSKGNIITPQEVINAYGRDVLRYYLLSSTPWNDFYFNMEDVKEVAKQFNILRNTFNFVGTYVTKLTRPKMLKVEDKWILSKMNNLIKNYLEYFKNYNGHKAAQETMNFILNDFSRWYIKIIRDRVWPLYEGKDKNAAFYTLVTVTENLVKLLAPICPFVAEDIYQNIVKKFKKGLDSIHMYEFPKPNNKLINKRLENQMEIVKTLVETSHAARQKVNLKLRWPVKRMFVLTKNKDVKLAMKGLQKIILEICNVESVKVVTKSPKGNFAESEFNKNKVFLDLTEDKEIVEKRLYRELTRKVQALRKQHNFVVDDRIKLTLKSDSDTEKSLKKNVKSLRTDVGAKTVDVGILKGKYTGELKFGNRVISIRFDKIDLGNNS